MINLLKFLIFALSMSFIHGQSLSAADKPEFQLEELQGTWELISINDQELKQDQRKPELSFLKEHKLAGSTGVNRLMGKWDPKSEKPFAGPIATTRRAGPPAAMKLEREFLQSLTKINTIEMNKNQLVLKGKEMALIFGLKKSKKQKDNQ